MINEEIISYHVLISFLDQLLTRNPHWYLKVFTKINEAFITETYIICLVLRGEIPSAR